MLCKLRSHLAHNVVGYLALFVALGGSAYAVTALPANSVGTKQLKKNAITTPKIKNGAVTGPKVKASTLGRVPFAARASTAERIAGLPAVTQITTFENGWSDYRVGDDPAGFYRDAMGIVHLTGAIHGGTVPSYAFTLPAGYQGTGFFASGSSDASSTSKGPCTVGLYVSALYVDGGCDNREVGLDGITFRPIG